MSANYHLDRRCLREEDVQQLQLVVSSRPAASVRRLSTKPISFSYFPSLTTKHPWVAISDPHDLPLLALSNEDEAVYAEDDWQHRDVVFVESSPLGTARLAELLLNAGCTWNQTREYELEGEAGFRGVAPLSAEVQIFLPGSDYWPVHPRNRRTTSA